MAKIKFKDVPSIEDSIALNHLYEMIKEETPFTPVKTLEKLPNTKGDITTTIEIINLALTAITTLITVIQFWKSQYPQYSISIKVGDDTFDMENLSKEEFDSALKDAEEKQQKADLLISKVHE